MKIKIPFLNQKKSCNRKRISTNPLQSAFFKINWDSLLGRLNCYNKTWSYNRKKKGCRKDFFREPKEKDAPIKT